MTASSAFIIAARTTLPRRGMLLLPLAIAACGGPPPAQTIFPPLTYDYLTRLRLNVATIAIDDSWIAPPAAAQLLAYAPVQPVAELRQMAQDRLFASGTSGQAVFKIEEASITQVGARLQASFAVQLTVGTTDGTRSGYAEARVVRAATLVDDDLPTLRAALYNITRATMEDMNVEFEFQVRRSLRDYLQGPGAPAPAPVQSQDLPAPGTPSPPPATAP